MYLQEAIALFCKTRSPELLQTILKQHGKRGFALACRAAGMSREAGRRMVGAYSDSGAIAQLAKRACGLKTPRWQ